MSSRWILDLWPSLSTPATIYRSVVGREPTLLGLLRL
jgi:hypothetical protein